VARKALPFEFMLNTLRLREGFDEALFTERTGLPPSALAAGLAKAQARGLLESADSTAGRRWLATNRGFDFLSDLQEMFL
jgi:oxygen-independent coproporphyrinogen-3 oxidase